MHRNEGKRFLLPFRENEKVLQDRYIFRECVGALGPTVSFVGHGQNLKLTRQTIIELDALYNISFRERAKIAICNFSTILNKGGFFIGYQLWLLRGAIWSCRRHGTFL